MDQERTEAAASEEIDETKPWAARIPGQKARLVSYLNQSGKTPPEAIKDLLDMFERTKQLEGPQHKELDGIRHHLNLAAQLAEAVVIQTKDEVARLGQQLTESKGKLQEAQAGAHESRGQFERELGVVRDQLVTLQTQNEELQTAHDAAIKEKGQLVKIAGLAQETAEAFKNKAEAYDTLAAELQTAKATLADQKSQFESTTRELKDLKVAFGKAAEDANTRLQTEKANVLAQAGIDSEKAIVAARKSDLDTIEGLRQQISATQTLVNEAKSGALDRERDLVGENERLRQRAETLTTELDKLKKKA